MAEVEAVIASLDSLVQTVADARAARWWIEAELSALVPTDAVEAITLAVAELLNAACAPGQPVHLRVRVHADEVRVDVECRRSTTPDVDDLARSILTAVADVWGLRVVGETATFWTRLRLI